MVTDETSAILYSSHSPVLILAQQNRNPFHGPGDCNYVTVLVIFQRQHSNAKDRLSATNVTMQRLVKSRFGSERKTKAASKKSIFMKPIKATKAALPAAYIIVAGPLVSFFPLGSFAPVLSILVTSFASSYLEEKFVGVAVVFVHAGGFRNFEGRVLALLSFLSFSSVFGKLSCISIISCCILTGE